MGAKEQKKHYDEMAEAYGLTHAAQPTPWHTEATPLPQPHRIYRIVDAAGNVVMESDSIVTLDRIVAAVNAEQRAADLQQALNEATAANATSDAHLARCIEALEQIAAAAKRAASHPVSDHVPYVAHLAAVADAALAAEAR